MDEQEEEEVANSVDVTDHQLVRLNRDLEDLGDLDLGDLDLGDLGLALGLPVGTKMPLVSIIKELSNDL